MVRPCILPSVLFVCLGNICRSPLAEAALRHTAELANVDLVIDSAGTGSWHVGNPPDPRAIAEARRHGIDIASYRARQVGPEDFHRFDRIFALDTRNLAELRNLAPPQAKAKLSLLLDVVPGMAERSVVDPYYGEDDGFGETWREVSLAARHILTELQQ